MTHQGAGQRGGCSPCFGRGFGTDVGKAGLELGGGPCWCCLGSPHRSMLQHRNSLPGPLLPSQGDIGWGWEGCALPIWLCHALLASGPHAGRRTSGLQTGLCWSTGLLLQKPHWAVLRAAKSPRAVNLGSFLLVCQQAGMCRREAAHFQGLCEQEGQLLEFEAASSTKFVLAVLSLPGQGRGTSWLSAFLLQYV